MGFDNYGMASAFDGTPSFTLLDTVKNPAIQGDVGDLLNEWNSYNSGNSKDLNSFLSNWSAATPEVTAQTGQEVGDISGFYNGTVASELAGNTAASAAANRTAGNQALAYATQNRNAGQLTSGTGNSSYNSRLAIGQGNAIDIANAQQTAAETAANTKYVLGQQTALAGQRENLENNLAQRSLVPIQARDSTLSASTSALGSIQNINNANNFYGLSQNQSFWDQLGAFSDAFLNTAEAGASVGMGASGMGGMGGGGSSGGGNVGNNGGPAASAAASAGNFSAGGIGDSSSMSVPDGSGIPNYANAIPENNTSDFGSGYDTGLEAMQGQMGIQGQVGF